MQICELEGDNGEEMTVNPNGTAVLMLDGREVYLTMEQALEWYVKQVLPEPFRPMVKMARKPK